jgi:hypothetical protein
VAHAWAPASAGLDGTAASGCRERNSQPGPSTSIHDLQPIQAAIASPATRRAGGRAVMLRRRTSTPAHNPRANPHPFRHDRGGQRKQHRSRHMPLRADLPSLRDIPTPALVLDGAALDANIARMVAVATSISSPSNNSHVSSCTAIKAHQQSGPSRRELEPAHLSHRCQSSQSRRHSIQVHVPGKLNTAASRQCARRRAVNRLWAPGCRSRRGHS